MHASSHLASDFSRHLPYLKMAEFCESWGCNVNARDKFCFKCGHKVPENSPTRQITPEEENASSSSSAKSLSQFVASKAEKRRRFSLKESQQDEVQFHKILLENPSTQACLGNP